MGLLKKFGAFLINFTIFFLIVTFSPGLPPKTTFPFEEFSVAKTLPLEGPLKINSLLDNAERLFEGKLDQPEHLLERDGAIYASLRNGDVVKIVDDQIEVLVNFGKSCYNTNYDENYPCSRPLGMAFDTIGDNLIVVDTFHGIYKLSLKDGKVTQLVSEKDIIGYGGDIALQRPCKLFNSVAIAKNGDIFFSHSSSDYGIDKVIMTVFPNPSGRLCHYERATGIMNILLDKMWFANGIVLAPDESFVVVADSNWSRLMKVWLTGRRVIEADVFIEGLPGAPDNLTPDAEGIWVPLAVSADDDHPLFAHNLAAYPIARRFLGRLLELIKMPFQLFHNFIPTQCTSEIIRKIGSMEMFGFLFPARRTIIRLDWDGNVVKSLHGFDKSAGVTTHVLEYDGYLYLGSVTSNYIARVKKP